MTFITASVKTQKQITDHLKDKGYTQAVVDYVIAKLEDYGFLSDQDYARRYVETYANKKGVKESDMENALEELGSQGQTATAIAEKYMRGKPMDIKTMQKLYRHLLSKGFTYDDAKSAVEKIKLTDDEIE